ncbi:hypothetical protein A3Q56_08537 [Intoshia linei]|uniref:Major facilitator superfamily (MFS) profile domain-containing protein n=1 Tax=Intoshia linei TaxID=1819745 RepID=A0A177AP11_9BILA|nr:hypothetical protein A3Q56_08537 [Intoshia linei]
MGVCNGGMQCLISILCSHFLGKEDSFLGLGAVSTLMSIPLLVGPIISGLVHDRFYRYDVVFSTSASFVFFAAIFMTSSLYYSKNKNVK